MSLLVRGMYVYRAYGVDEDKIASQMMRSPILPEAAARAKNEIVVFRKIDIR